MTVHELKCIHKSCANVKTRKALHNTLKGQNNKGNWAIYLSSQPTHPTRAHKTSVFIDNVRFIFN